MPYGSLLADVVKSSTSSPITFQNTSGTEIGTLCRAWVNFNGTGTVAIRSSFNVSSITDNGTGDYTVNFTTAMPDVSYSISGSATLLSSGASAPRIMAPYDVDTQTTSSSRVRTGDDAGTVSDMALVCVVIHR